MFDKSDQEESGDVPFMHKGNIRRLAFSHPPFLFLAIRKYLHKTYWNIVVAGV
jgi:hypothetical protein